LISISFSFFLFLDLLSCFEGHVEDTEEEGDFKIDGTSIFLFIVSFFLFLFFFF